METCVNQLKDLALNKGLENLDALRKKLFAATDRLAAAFALSPQGYTLNQLRYDLRKMKRHVY